MGSVKKETNGTWTVYYDRPAGGKRNQTSKRGFVKEGDAKDFLRDVETAVKKRTYVTPSKILFIDYIDDVFFADLDKKIKQGRRKTGTRLYYQGIFGKKPEDPAAPLPLFREFFKGDRLQDLTDSRIEKYLDVKRATGVKENTVLAHYKAIRMILRRAERGKAIEFNPIHTVDLPQYTKPEISFWEPDMIPDALKLFIGTEIEWHVRIALLTLLREGEICALHEDFFDHSRMEFEVREQAQQVPGEGLVFVTPKSDASEAWLPLTDEVEKLIIKRKMENHSYHVQYRDKYSEEYLGRLSVRKDGTLIRPKDLYKQYRKILIAQDKIPYITFHDLRHTGAVWHIEKETPMKVLQRLLRHADFGTTSNIYADASKKLLRASAANISLG